MHRPNRNQSREFHDNRDRRFARHEGGHDGLPRGFDHRGHDHRGRSSLGRFFAHGDLRLVILNLIADKPRHGYEVIKAIEEQVAGAYSPSPGVVYPTLTMLEELGYVVVTTVEAGKKLHEITEQGRAYLDVNRTALDGLLARMAEASRAQGRNAAPQIVRAMENLKLALRLRLSAGQASAEQIDAIAAALDGAAAAVEKI